MTNHLKVAKQMAPVPSPATEPRVVEGRGFLSESRPILVVAPSGSTCGELVGAFQSLGLPAAMATNARDALYWVHEILPAISVIDLRAEGARILIPELRKEHREIVALSDDAQSRTDALAEGCVESHHVSDGPSEIARHVASLVRSRDLRRLGHITAGPLKVDLVARRLLFQGVEVPVSPLILNVAAHLAARAGSYVPATVLLEHVWAEPWADRGKVQLAVLRLRRALGLSSESMFLSSRRGHGYGIFPENWQGSLRRIKLDA